MREIGTEIGSHGEFNFLLSDGDRLYAHCSSRLVYVIRQSPFPVAHLADEDLAVDFNEVTTPEDRVAVIATTPLTDNETWTSITPGTLQAFHLGALEDMGSGTTIASAIGTGLPRPA